MNASQMAPASGTRTKMSPHTIGSVSIKSTGTMLKATRRVEVMG